MLTSPITPMLVHDSATRHPHSWELQYGVMSYKVFSEAPLPKKKKNPPPFKIPNPSQNPHLPYQTKLLL